MRQEWPAYYYHPAGIMTCRRRPASASHAQQQGCRSAAGRSCHPGTQVWVQGTWCGSPRCQHISSFAIAAAAPRLLLVVRMPLCGARSAGWHHHLVRQSDASPRCSTVC